MIGLNSVWISYAFIKDNETSWTERIFMKDIVKALSSEDRVIRHKCERADGLRHVTIEAKVSSLVNKDGLTVYLDYSSSNNETSKGKNSGDPGLLVMHWNSELKAFEEAPDTLAFTPAKTDEPEFPVFRFLPHRDNSVKYFTFIDYKGAKRRMTEPFHAEQFEKYKKMFDQSTFDTLLEYVAMRVEKAGDNGDFAVGWLFPNPWPLEIMPVYHKLLTVFGNEAAAYEHSAYMLSGLVQTAILGSTQKWEAFKMPWGSRALMFHKVKV